MEAVDLDAVAAMLNAGAVPVDPSAQMQPYMGAPPWWPEEDQVAGLEQLQAGRRPVSGEYLPAVVWPDGTPVAGSGTYAKLENKADETDSGFVPYVPEDLEKKQKKAKVLNVDRGRN